MTTIDNKELSENPSCTATRLENDEFKVMCAILRRLRHMPPDEIIHGTPKGDMTVAEILLEIDQMTPLGADLMRFLVEQYHKKHRFEAIAHECVETFRACIDRLLDK